MKIKTKIYILFAVFLTAIVAMLSVFYFTSQQISEAIKSNEDVIDIRNAITKLRTQTFNYIFYNSENQEQDSQAVKKILLELLSPEEHTAHNHSEAESALLDQIHLNISDLDKLFSQLTQAGISNELERQTSSQIIAIGNDTALMASQLSQLANKRFIDNLTIANRLRTILVILLLVVALAMLFIMVISILRPLAKLYRGTEEIAQGNLDYRVGIESEDEIGQLGKSFDQMVEVVKKYMLLYETSSEAIMIIEPPDWKFTDGNPAAIKMFNCKDKKEFISLGPWDFSPEKQPDGLDSLKKAQKMIMQAVESGNNYFEWTHKRYKGEDFPARVLLSRFKKGEKNVIQATVRDMSKEKKAQEKIIQFADITKKTLDNMIPVLRKISKGDFSKNIKIPEKENEFTELLVALNRMIDDLKELNADSEKQRENLQNAKTAAQNILHDLRLEKEALANSKAKDEALLASIGDGIIATGPDRRIIIMNKVAEKLLGWKIDEALGKFYDDVVLLEDEKGTFVSSKEKPLNKAFIGGTTTFTSILYLISKNKIKFPVAITVSPVILDNKIIGAVEVFRDVTHEREIDRAKTEFVSLASHQLRTPLTGINWLTEMLADGDLGKISKKQKETIEAVHRSAKQMTELIGALLNVSRLELGTFSINPKSIEPNKIIDEILQELSQIIFKKEIKIKKDYLDETLLINADPILLKIVYQNMLSNAVNYTLPKTTVTVKINKDNNNLLFTVTNCGIGISKKEQPKIFTKLFRASNAQLFVTNGTGLGLYIAKLIMDAVDGKIWFDSELNKKTNFYASLPLKGMATRNGGKILEISSNKI